MARYEDMIDGGGDSFYSAVAEAQAAAAAPAATKAPLESFREKEADEPIATRQIVDEQTKAREKAAQTPQAPDLTTTPYEIDPLNFHLLMQMSQMQDLLH